MVLYEKEKTDMALKNCPECKEQVSESALFCPHCGYVLDGKRIKKVKNSIIVKFEGGKADVADVFMIIFLLGIFGVIILGMLITKF